MSLTASSIICAVRIYLSFTTVRRPSGRERSSGGTFQIFLWQVPFRMMSQQRSCFDCSPGSTSRFSRSQFLYEAQSASSREDGPSETLGDRLPYMACVLP